MNVIARLEYELAYYDSAVHCFNHYTTRYPAKTITDDYANDIALLANAPAQAETLLHCLEWAAAGIGLHINAHKTEYMCFNQTGNISRLNSSSLKLVDKFTYLRSSVSSEDLPGAMDDRERWRERFRDICADGTTWWWWWFQTIQFSISTQLNCPNISISSNSV